MASRATSGTSGSLGKRHKHNLDPSKLVIVRFSLANDHYWWVIADQGCGFNPPYNCHADPTQYLPLNKQKVVGVMYSPRDFDQVQWNPEVELKLGKQVNNRFRLPLVC